MEPPSITPVGPLGGVKRAQAQPRTGRPWRRLKARVRRENDVCWLCGQVVDKTLAWPDPLSASVDHVVPLAMGGPLLDPANVRLAHLGCNARRGRHSRQAKGRNPLPASRTW